MTPTQAAALDAAHKYVGADLAYAVALSACLQTHSRFGARLAAQDRVQLALKARNAAWDVLVAATAQVTV